MNINKVLKYPMNTEKAVRMMEMENKLTFIVDLKANKRDVKKAIENLFNVKVKRINTMITPQGRKKAVIMLTKDSIAGDVMMKIGLV